MSRAYWLMPLVAALGCGGSGVKVTGVQIVTVSGGPLTAGVGDALQLMVVETLADGTTQPLPTGVTATWTDPPTVTALDPTDLNAPNPIPTPGPDPTAFFVDNPGRPDRNADLPGVVFISDAGASGSGSLTVSATVSGISAPNQSTVSVSITAGPTGDAGRGMTLFGVGGPDCAGCHGDSGNGSPPIMGTTDMYKLGDGTYDFPAPGLNAGPGHVASDPTWSATKLAITARSDMKNTGVTARVPMPDWLSKTNPVSGNVLSTQDLVDIYTFLATQTQ